MATLAMSMDESSITDWVFPGRSFLKGEALAKFVRGLTGGKQIEGMRIPLGIVAADLQSGQPILFRKGDPGMAVRASSAVPGVFEPVKIGGHEYIDGGAVSPIPVRFARQMGADVIIAVDISAIPEGQPTKGAVDILLQTFNIMGHSISQFELQDADVVMRPKLEGVGSAEFSARRLSILAGREAALMVLPQLKERIAAKTR
jgi:NTE family protein